MLELSFFDHAVVLEDLETERDLAWKGQLDMGLAETKGRHHGAQEQGRRRGRVGRCL